MSDHPHQPAHVALIFSCTRCGFCCQGETTVSLDEYDQERMIRVLGLSREETARRYWRITDGVVQMQVMNGHCIFFDGEHGCTVHDGRPWRCRQWPLHPSMLADKDNYQTIVESCPGLNKELGFEEFRRILQLLLERGDCAGPGR